MCINIHFKYLKKYKITRYQYYDIKFHKNCFFYHKTIDLRSRLIYKHTNKINGMCYIGQCLQYQNMTYEQSMLFRWQGHCEAAIRLNSYNTFHKAIREFGQENFEHEVIDQFIPNQEEENEAEMYWIELYNCVVPNGYNMNKGGSGNTGLTQTQETRNKIGDGNRGKKRTHQMNEKRYVLVNQYDLLGNFIKTWDSIQEASESTNIFESTIIYCCQKKYKSGGGFIWRYASDLDQNIKPYKKKHYTRKIQQFDLNNNLIYVWNTLQEASNCLKISKGNICSCARGKRPHAGGYIWRYVTNED
jgi:hypothetical protein